MQVRRLRKLALVLSIGLIVIGAASLMGQAMFERRNKAKLEERLDEIIRLIDVRPSASFHETVDAVRIFINDHSQTKTGPAFHAMNGDNVAFAEGVIAHARDASVERVHMECSTRAYLMSRVLRGMGLETRGIGIFATSGDYSSHSFLDVFNGDSKTWETVDPDYDLYWVSKRSGKRISLAEAGADLDDVSPCGRDRCGWDLVSRDGHTPKSLVDKLDILSVTHREKDLRYSVYTPRADLKRKLSFRGETGTFCELFPRRCREGFNAIGGQAQESPP